MASIYDYTVRDMSGNDISLADYKGKVLLIVNTATGCGFTPQYEGLQALYDKYKEQGFEILDFPCNQFFRQAPGTDEEIHTFCTFKYNVSFKQFHKIDVNGGKEDPLYTYLKSQQKGRIKWNFTKFLVDREGNVVNRFGPAEKPAKFEAKIAEIL
jgi:glutathione peroxidase